MCAAVVPEPRPLKFAPTLMVLATVLITTTAAPVPAEPLGGTSFEPTSLVTNRRFCACEAGTNRHVAPMAMPMSNLAAAASELTRIGDPSHLRKVHVDVCVGVLAKFLMQSSQTQKAAGLGCHSRAGNDHVCRSSHGSRGAGSFS